MKTQLLPVLFFLLIATLSTSGKVENTTQDTPSTEVEKDDDATKESSEKYVFPSQSRRFFANLPFIIFTTLLFFTHVTQVNNLGTLETGVLKYSNKDWKNQIIEHTTLYCMAFLFYLFFPINFLMGMKIVNKEGKKASFWQVTKRFLVSYPPLFPLFMAGRVVFAFNHLFFMGWRFLIFLSIPIMRNSQGIHGWASNTIIVRRKKRYFRIW